MVEGAAGQSIRERRPRGLTQVQGRDIGRRLLKRPRKRGEQKLVAETLNVTPRAVRNWQRAARKDEPLPKLGRPPISKEVREEVRQRVAEQLEQSGYEVGEGAMVRLFPDLPRTLMRKELAVQKKARRKHLKEVAADLRTSITPLASDVLHGMDATRLGRDEMGERIEGQVLREVGTAEVLEATAGTTVTTSDAIAVLLLTWLTEGRVPLVLMTDGGSPYTSKEFEDFLRDFKVVHMINVPRTPEHNAATERAVREVKDVTGLSKHARIRRQMVRRLLSWAKHVLNVLRIRPSRGGMSAVDYRQTLPPWYDLVSRDVFHAAASAAIRDATRGVASTTKRRRRTRRAILETLERFGLIRWIRGGGQSGTHKAERIM